VSTPTRMPSSCVTDHISPNSLASLTAKPAN
jgi:hypothetical protein